MPDIKLTVASWDRFETRELAIEPELVGSVHEFKYEGYLVRIQLPSTDYLPTKRTWEGPLLLSGWREVDGQDIPLGYVVSLVEIFVSIPEQISVPEEILGQHPNAYDLVPENRQVYLKRLVARARSVAEKAFDIWVRTLRWKADDSAIARPRIITQEVERGTYLVTGPNRQRIWAGPVSIKAHGVRNVTPEVWAATGSALERGQLPPISIELMFDATEYLKLGDLRRATIDMAIACESFLRMLVVDSLSHNPNSAFSTAARAVLDEVNISVVLGKFAPSVLDEEEKRQLGKIEPRLRELFKERNTLVHTGRDPGLTEEKCQKFLAATRKLLTIR